MSPNLSALVAAADVAKQNVVILESAADAAAKMADAAVARQTEAEESVARARAELASAHAAIVGALQEEYGEKPAPPSQETVVDVAITEMDAATPA